jgi:hypothetical protein
MGRWKEMWIVNRIVAGQPLSSSKTWRTRMKLLLGGIVIGMVLGVMLTVIYFSLATFSGAVSGRMAKQKSPEESIKCGEDKAVSQKMKARAGK